MPADMKADATQLKKSSVWAAYRLHFRRRNEMTLQRESDTAGKAVGGATKCKHVTLRTLVLLPWHFKSWQRVRPGSFKK